MVFLATFQLTLGTYAWVYLGQVACDEGLAVATAVLWLCVLVLSLVTSSMFSVMHNVGTFGFFAVCTLISSAFFHWFLRETKGISREQAQAIYSEKPSKPL